MKTLREMMDIVELAQDEVEDVLEDEVLEDEDLEENEDPLKKIDELFKDR